MAQPLLLIRILSLSTFFDIRVYSEEFRLTKELLRGSVIQSLWGHRMQKHSLYHVLVLFLLTAHAVGQTSRPTSRPTGAPATTQPASSGLGYPRDLWREDFDRPSIEGLVRVVGEAKISRQGTAVAVDVALDPTIRRVACSVVFPLSKTLLFEQASRLKIRLRATPTGNGGLPELRLNLFDRDRRAAFSKGMSVEPGDWREVVIELRTMIPYYGVPRWSAIDRIGLQLYTVGRYEIDSMALEVEYAGASPYWPEDKVREMAFAGRKLRIVRRGSIVVMTDARRVRDDILASLAGSAAFLSREIGREFGGSVGRVAKLERPVFVLLFERDGRYRNFWSRVSREYGAQMDAPGEFSTAQLGFVTVWAKKRPRVVDPTWLEACMQMILAQRVGLAARSNWLTDGLAGYYQNRSRFQDLHKDKGLRSGFASERKLDKIEVLTSGSALEFKERKQAASLVSWLMDTELRRAGMVTLVARVAVSGDVQLSREVQPCFALSLAQVEAQWTDWAKQEIRVRRKPRARKVKPKKVGSKPAVDGPRAAGRPSIKSGIGK